MSYVLGKLVLNDGRYEQWERELVKQLRTISGDNRFVSRGWSYNEVDEWHILNIGLGQNGLYTTLVFTETATGYLFDRVAPGQWGRVWGYAETSKYPHKTGQVIRNGKDLINSIIAYFVYAGKLGEFDKVGSAGPIKPSSPGWFVQDASGQAIKGPFASEQIAQRQAEEGQSVLKFGSGNMDMPEVLRIVNARQLRNAIRSCQTSAVQ